VGTERVKVGVAIRTGDWVKLNGVPLPDMGEAILVNLDRGAGRKAFPLHLKRGKNVSYPPGEG